MGEFSSKLSFFLILHLASLLSLGIAEDTIAPGQSINDNQTLVSAGGIFELGFFRPGSSKNRYLGIWYNNISVQTVVWVANRQSPLSDSTGVLTIASNGSLILANATGTVFWSTPATSAGSPVAQLLDNGNFVVLDAANNITGSYAWQGFDYPSDSLLPGMKIGWDLHTGLNRYISVWKNRDDPSPGNFSMVMDTLGVPQIFLKGGSVRLWRSGPWVGQRFTGIPEMKTYDMFTFSFVANSDEIYYKFDIRNHSITSKLTVNQSGIIQRQVWLGRSNSWNIFWFAPKDQCDSISPCGPYGLCSTNDSPICNCLQGFKPKSPQDWFLRDGSDGCVRKTPLDCQNGTDGFVTVSGAKLPDTSNATVNMSMSLGDCGIACLSNCSCTAYATADVGGGNGCFMWFSELTDLRVYITGGQDLYVRMAADDLDYDADHPTAFRVGRVDSASSSLESLIIGGSVAKEHPNNRGVAVVISVSIVLGTFLLLGWIGYYTLKRLRTKKRGLLVLATTTSSISAYNNEDSRAGDLELPLFDMGTIRAATDNFSSEKKLGEGGFGPVYKGRLLEGQDVAVKRLSKTSVQGVDEFMNEVSLIAKLQHRNLVRLLGCCIEREERLLIYEYMPNKSLDAFLFDKAKGVKLDWQTRYNIIVGIARGLLYLHEDSRLRIIHRDLKASNILLDEEMNPKISDFGMARIFGGDETEANTLKVVGTYGYMSPEYAMNGIFSVKSDVFSFGVLVLEIISGKKNRGVYQTHPFQNLLAHAWYLLREGNGLELVDDSMGCLYPMIEVIRCIKVGLLCVQDRSEDRPTMSSVVVMLRSEDVPLPQPKQPGFALSCGLVEVMHSSSNTDNDVTVTLFEGR